jgi:hypothetical protein
MLQAPWHILELFVKSPCFLHPVFGPPFTPYPLFQWYPQSKEILLNLSMKCSKLSSQCTRFKCNYRSCTGRSSENIYVAAVEALRKKERQDETQFTTKIDAL